MNSGVSTEVDRRWLLFTATWSPLSMLVADYLTSSNAVFETVDVDEMASIADLHNVRVIPTAVLVSNGVRGVAVIGREILKAMLSPT